MPTISYAITACNEHVELDRLLEILREPEVGMCPVLKEMQ